MRTETIEIYTFEELSDEAKEVALDAHRYINVDDSYWYEHITEELESYGVDVIQFDITRWYIVLEVGDYDRLAESILKNHGESTPTYKAAKDFVAKGDLGNTPEALDACNEFRAVVGYQYLKMYQSAYDFETSDTQVRQTIVDNEFEFYKSGKPY